MNRSNLKSYAPQARRDFIEAVTDRAASYGLTASKVEPVVEKGDVAIIGDKAFPRVIASKRKKLELRIKQDGFDQVMEAMAYTWFNRLIAVRYMELHGYLEHGYRVVSHPEGKTSPEIVEHAEDLDLPELDQQKVIELKLEGTKESELYRMLLVAQCNALSKAMPFLFERIDDETELLLPENLLHSDSVIRELVEAIPEEDWQEVEIIGWLYQFYISDKKDEVIGKVVKSEDIPAATQLFTPNWIVRYLIQNTLGRQWIATYPNSPLKHQMEYYVEPAEQTVEVESQLKQITPDSLNPEELTLLDPACGSGHILVEAYDLLKGIYLERGYRAKDIPRLILEKNLYGLELDDRAAQLATFALMMKARADDRRLFSAGVHLKVVAIQESKGLVTKEITEALNAPLQTEDSISGISQDDVALLIELFDYGTTFGSLIRLPVELVEKLSAIALRVQHVLDYGGLLEQASIRGVNQLIQQARILAETYDVVVTNPPYMGSKYFNPLLKTFIQREFATYDKDLFSAFIIRNRQLAKPNGYVGFMSPFVWMFIASHAKLRDNLLDTATVTSLIQLEYSGFAEATVPICTFILANSHCPGFKASFIRLSDFRGADIQGPRTLEAIRNPKCGWYYLASPDDFKKIPGSPFAYWVSDILRDTFAVGKPLSEIGKATLGMNSTNNDLFVRLWHEVDYDTIGFGFSSNEEATISDYRWFPYNKGGRFRKWNGNRYHVINWYKGGKDIHEYNRLPMNYRGAPVRSKQYQFRESITWSFISSSYFGVRYSPKGSLFDVAGSSYFTDSDKMSLITAFLCSKVAFRLLQALNPTLNFQVGNVGALPIVQGVFDKRGKIEPIARECVAIAQKDWDSQEISWDYKGSPLITSHSESETIETALHSYHDGCVNYIQKMLQLETEINRLFIEGYDLQDELSPNVPEVEITLYRPEKEEDIKRVLSYAIGCLMGRYSLDTQGIIYAHRGNEDYNPSMYNILPADEDGIIPITDFNWFDDDGCSRFEGFIATVWNKKHLEDNLKYVAESLSPKRGESSRETIRRYIANGFFKHHLQTYKKRPIYWLFSSGKQRAYQCLVYLHRYNEGTLARMRTEYVIPLQGKIAARIDQLDGDIAASTSTSHRKKLEKERDTLVKQRTELQTFDEKLRHYADQRITLDLDDGVKVNYRKFGDLLAEVKAVTGKKAS